MKQTEESQDVGGDAVSKRRQGRGLLRLRIQVKHG